MSLSIGTYRDDLDKYDESEDCAEDGVQAGYP